MILSVKTLLFAFVLFGLIVPPNNDEIIWSKNYSLTWDDFKGAIKNDRNGAETSSGIAFREMKWEKQSAKGKVVAIFHKNNSWTRVKDEYSLKHEQVHFDITELFARKLRKKLSISSYKSSTLSKSLEKDYYKINNAMNDYQEKYDVETTGRGINKEKQSKWNKKVEKELKLLSKYSSPEVVIKIKR